MGTTGMTSAVIAIVDDDQAILTGLSSLVRSAGYRTRLSSPKPVRRCPIAC